MSTKSVSSRRGWTVVLAGTAINLALGILYAWSILKGAIVDSINQGGVGAFTWEISSANDPYAVACLAFAFSMIVAGKMQDKFGPKLTSIIGGLMVGGGFIMASHSTNYWTWIVGFGLLFGCGMGFAYSAATPPALRWFPPAKTGLIAGIVVAGFGLAPVYIAPTAKYLLGAYGLQHSMLIFGIAFSIVVSLFGMLLSNPPAGFVADPNAAKSVTKKTAVEDKTPSQILRSGKFYVLWATFFIGAGAGLMVIGSAKGLATASLGEWAFLVVAVMSIGNAAGRVIAGVVSDKIGRANTLIIMLAFQAALMFAAIPLTDGTYNNAVALVMLVTFMVFNYGTNLSLFPSFAKDYWGAKNYGVNYGILFSAWGIGAFTLVRISEVLKARAGGSFTMSFAAAGALLIVGAMLASTLRTRKAEVPELAPAFEEEEDLALSRATND
ncbi:MAG: MFS transporter [Desulfuromonas sp.]|nr:MAG: MFS transporter [Desulfuromonas sp.]